MNREIRLAKKILESAGYKVVKATMESIDYEAYSEKQFSETLDNIAGRLEEIISELRDTYYDNRDDLIDELDSMTSELYAMDDYLPEDLYARSEELKDNIRRAEDTEYEGPTVYRDPYRDRGLNPSDFY